MNTKNFTHLKNCSWIERKFRILKKNVREHKKKFRDFEKNHEYKKVHEFENSSRVWKKVREFGKTLWIKNWKNEKQKIKKNHTKTEWKPQKKEKTGWEASQNREGFWIKEPRTSLRWASPLRTMGKRGVCVPVTINPVFHNLSTK